MTASAQAVAAVIAAKHAHQWGDYAAVRYAERRGATFRMYMIALRVETSRLTNARRKH